MNKNTDKPIGIFDSGLGGLTVLKDIVRELPEYDYLYFGDNARTPYGTRSFEVVYKFTLECVTKMFSMGCHLVILACNTASAKALRTIQKNDLPQLAPNKRVLGVLRPTTEIVGNYSQSKHIGVLGTNGTVSSESYPVEIRKNFPEAFVFQQACPMWVPLVENGEHEKEGANYFIKEDLKQLFAQSSAIDTIILGCTHYPLLMGKISEYTPKGVKVISQGEIVSHSLKDYLLRHPEMDANCSKNSSVKFYTTDLPATFNAKASIFFGAEVTSQQLKL